MQEPMLFAVLVPTVALAFAAALRWSNGRARARAEARAAVAVAASTERAEAADRRAIAAERVLAQLEPAVVVVDGHGSITGVRSATFDRWFGAPAAGTSLADHIRPHAPAAAQGFADRLAELAVTGGAAERVLARLPARITVGDRSLVARYRLLAGEPRALLVMLDDLAATAPPVPARSPPAPTPDPAAASAARIEIDRAELEAALPRATGVPTLHALLSSWVRPPLAPRFERLARQAVALARRHGRPTPTVLTSGGALRMDDEGWRPFWAALADAVGHAATRGAEELGERRRAGKPDAVTIELGAHRHRGRLIVTVRDDGRGAPGRDGGDDVHAALGRVVRSMGGALVVEVTPGEGTLVRAAFDEARASESLVS
jgi:hypothetical protein